MINGYGFIEGNGGYAIHVREFFRALNRQTPVCLAPLDFFPKRSQLSPEILAMMDRAESINLSNPAICLADAARFHLFNGSWRIGYTVFEGTRLEQRSLNLLRQVDEVWVPSQWGRRVLLDNGITDRAIEVVAEGFDPAVYSADGCPPPSPTTDSDPCSGTTPTAERPDDDVFTFVSVGKWEPRKGQAMLLRAWAEVFGARRDVRLLALWHNPYVPGFSLLDEIKRLELTAVPNATLLAPLPDAAAVARLYHSADCFVLPSRAEGWGLPMMEAMACGLPVITTDYSAPTDYLDPDYTYPLAVAERIDIHDPIWFPQKGSHGVWANPDFEQLKTLLLHVFEHRDEARDKGRKAAQAMRERWTWDHAAGRAVEILASRGLL